jgi:hypothetical protein
MLSKMFRPIAAFTAKPLGIVVGAIKDTFTRLPPLSALGQMDARTQADVWGLWYVFLLTWPLLHQILIDRQVPRRRVLCAWEHRARNSCCKSPLSSSLSAHDVRMHTRGARTPTQVQAPTPTQAQAHAWAYRHQNNTLQRT